MSEGLVRRDPDVIVAEVDGEPRLLHLRSWTYLACDEVGLRIWDHLAEPSDSDALVRALSEEYDGDEPRIRGDVEAFLARLHGEGFLIRG